MLHKIVQGDSCDHQGPVAQHQTVKNAPYLPDVSQTSSSFSSSSKRNQVQQFL